MEEYETNGRALGSLLTSSVKTRFLHSTKNCIKTI